jgi:hypothetical protein
MGASNSMPKRNNSNKHGLVHGGLATSNGTHEANVRACRLQQHPHQLRAEQSSATVFSTSAPFGCADKHAEKRCWLIYCEKKTLF